MKETPHISCLPFYYFLEIYTYGPSLRLAYSEVTADKLHLLSVETLQEVHSEPVYFHSASPTLFALFSSSSPFSAPPQTDWPFRFENIHVFEESHFNRKQLWLKFSPLWTWTFRYHRTKSVINFERNALNVVQMSTLCHFQNMTNYLILAILFVVNKLFKCIAAVSPHWLSFCNESVVL